MLTFWETSQGVELAATLIRELPKITAGKNSYACTLTDESQDEQLVRMINNGEARFAGSYVNSQGQTVVVLEN